MRAVMASIHPKWCVKIISGEKFLEVRKTKPNIELPFKVYIYETQCGGVIAEFICDKIIMSFVGYKDGIPAYWELLDGSGLTIDELERYGRGEILYGWHISNLKVYDTPKFLSEFKKFGSCPYNEKDGCIYPYHCFRAGETRRCGEYLRRPPQSWQFVEELNEN